MDRNDNGVFQARAAAPARPPEVAERQEFDHAMRTDTPDALRLFIARHPESRWRPEAEDRLRVLEMSAPKP